jgi:hypothetical protein
MTGYTMTDPTVTCSENHPEVDVPREVYNHDDGTERYQYRCIKCGLSLTAKQDRWVKLTAPITATGLNRIPLQVLVRANEFIR